MSLINHLEYLLTDIADTLAVPPSAYRQAEERYRAVGEWLCADGSVLEAYRPEVYAQGSFALGTVVRPLVGDDYDLDAVVHLSGSKASWTPARLKGVVGDRLKDNANYARMLQEEGRRCWTLQYAAESDRHGFHLDLLPSISATDRSKGTSLAITNRRPERTVEWRDSDPKGYAAWFTEQMKTLSQRRALLSGKVAGVEVVPMFERQTPLQYAVQLLKRYRDVLFCEADEHAPISVIITTLSAQAYEGEDSITDTLFGIVKRMENFIEMRGNSVRIPNPVRPSENFADRWEGDERKARAFLLWLQAAQKLESELLSAPPVRLGNVLSRLLGESAGRAVMEKFASRQGTTPTGITTATAVPAVLRVEPSRLRSALTSVLDLIRAVPHRVSPPWEMKPDGTSVGIRAYVTGGSGARRGQFSPGQPILPNVDLRFDADIRGASDAHVYWQVTNTGHEAERAKDLRGKIELGGTSRVESARYRGDHSIECFLVRRGACIARSGEFVVSIRA